METKHSNRARSRKGTLRGAVLAGALMALVGCQTSPAATTSSNTGGTNMQLQLTQEWDKTFPQSAKVEHRKVTFANRYGITLAADLYLPKKRGGDRLPAIVIGGPFGAVKEQSSGLLPEVNRERIGVIGICGWGGMALNAVAVDKRVKAVVTSTMYDMTRVMSKGYNDSVTLEQRTRTLEQLGQQRWKDAESGTPAYQPPYNELKGGEAQFLVDYHDYYMTPRGYHPRAVNSGNAWTMTTPLSFMNMPILTYIKEISPRPILFIHGEKAHSRYFSETAYAAAAEPKELLIVPGASHVDLYDRLDRIPFDRIAGFFDEHL
ncbi:alpha/beta hydrolase [Pseudomonas aeruginosa]